MLRAVGGQDMVFLWKYLGKVPEEPPYLKECNILYLFIRAMCINPLNIPKIWRKAIIRIQEVIIRAVRTYFLSLSDISTDPLSWYPP